MNEHEHVNDKAVALSIRGAKLTGRLLANAMQGFLKKVSGPSQKLGKQSLKSLTKQGATLEDITIPGNLSTFKKMAKQHHVDFSIKKDSTVNPPNWVIFFKAKDKRVIESVFNDYSKAVLKVQSRPSMLERLAKFVEKAKAVMAPVKNRQRGGHEI